MAEYDKVVFIKHAVETLGYFSKQMAETFRKEGFAICFVDYEDLFASLGRVRKFVEPGRTLLVTFNYIGLSGEDVFEDEGGKTIWESHGLLIFNILVDHPMYFHSKLVKEHANMQLFCVDREHVAYLQRFYPACRADFLPLREICCRARKTFRMKSGSMTWYLRQIMCPLRRFGSGCARRERNTGYFTSA